ncbi:MAG: pilin, partial [Patescibacteria group bacterium]
MHINYRIAFIVAFTFISLLAFFHAADAQTDDSFSCANPIVPCGRPGTPPCDLCNLYNLASNVVNYCLFCLILPISAIALLIGGILMLSSMGNPQRLQSGKTAITNTVIGVVLAFAAWLVIGTIVNTLGYENKGFSGAWNTFPGCIKPIGPAPSVPKEKCDNQNGPFSRPCTTSTSASGIQVCGDDGFWSNICYEYCDASQAGKTRPCTQYGCPGTNTCVGIPPALYVWTPECADIPTDSCVPTGSGKCPISPNPNSYCSVEQLSGTCFGSVASEAAQICWQESSGDPAAPGDRSLSADGVPLSIGLFQILLPCHTIGSLQCPTAFEGFTGRCGENKING